jgi:hypothetical protein
MQCAAASLVLVASVSGQSLAQDSTTIAKPTNSQGRLCWRGRPLPVCSSILLTEFGIYRDLVTPSGRRMTYSDERYEIRDSYWDLQTELGLLKNITQKYAFGGSVFSRYGPQEGLSLGAKARYRQWVTPDGMSVDFGAGFRVARDPSPGLRTDMNGNPRFVRPSRGPALTTDIAFNVMDYASFVARADVVKFNDRYQPKISVGVRGGSRVGTFGFAGFGTTLAILAVVFIATFEGS